MEYAKRPSMATAQSIMSTERTAIHDDIVQCFGMFAGAARARQRRVKHRPRFLDIVAVEHGADHELHVRQCDIGEKAEASLIDADQRHAERRELAGDREHRTVAADDDREIGCASKLDRRRRGETREAA